MDKTTISKNKEKKVAIVAEVKEKVDKAKAMVFYCHCERNKRRFREASTESSTIVI